MHIASENEAACMLNYLKVLDHLSAQEFVVSPDDDTDASSSSGQRAQTALTVALQGTLICEVVCLGRCVFPSLYLSCYLHMPACLIVSLYEPPLFPHYSVTSKHVSRNSLPSAGVSLLSSVITPAVLQHQPSLQLNYFSVLAYVLSSSPEFILPNTDSGGGAGGKLERAIGR